MVPKIDLHGYHLFHPAAWIQVRGEDAHDFLQSQFSNDLSQLDTGDVCYGLWLDQKGKVHGDSFILRQDEEAFFLMSYQSPEDRILSKLNGFIVADDVELEGMAGQVAGLSLLGDAVNYLDVIGLNPSVSGETNFEGESIFVLPGRRGFRPSIEFISSPHGIDRLVDWIKTKKAGTPCHEKGWMEVYRIQSLMPSIPADIGPHELPQEGRLENSAVSFTKGCYLGQEVMSRLHSLGQVRRSLRLFSADAYPGKETEVYFGSKKVGIVKSSAEYEGQHHTLVLLSNSIGSDGVLCLGSPESGKQLKPVFF